MTFDTPILFLVFNRPSTTSQVFQRIAEIRPTQLFVAADGPRAGRSDDIENCAQVQAIIDSVDWECRVTKLIRDQNLGCGPAVSSAITWFFNQVEAGIILEDDCLPSISFFGFAAELLKRYQDDPKILSVSGTNLLGQVPEVETSYYFTEFGGIWGWASWRRAWAPYDYRMARWADAAAQSAVLSRFSPPVARHLQKVFQAATTTNTWDYQWWFSKLDRQGFDIVPQRNLVRNIGFDVAGTHTVDIVNEFSTLRIEDLEFPLVHPGAVTLQPRLERRVSRTYYSDHSENWLSRLVRKAKTLVTRSNRGL